jgi:cell wall-associated NlpC family hydrolase
VTTTDNKGQVARSIARLHLGVPFLHQGRTEAGLDCVGLITRIADYFSIPYEDPKTYKNVPEKGVLRSALNTYLVPITMDQLDVGDVIELSWSLDRDQHVGIYCGYNAKFECDTMIHCMTNGVVEIPVSDRIRNKIKGVYAWPL